MKMSLFSSVGSIVTIAASSIFVSDAQVAGPKATQETHEVCSFVFEGNLETAHGPGYKVWTREKDMGESNGLVRTVDLQPLDGKTGAVDERSTIGSIQGVDNDDDGEWDAISIYNEPVKDSTDRTGMNSVYRVEAGKWGWKWQPSPLNRDKVGVVQFDDAKINHAIAQLDRAMERCHGLSNLTSARRWSEKQAKMVDVASWTAKESKP